MLWAECLFGLLCPAESHTKQRALAAEAQVARHGTEREGCPVSPTGRGVNPLLVSASHLLPNQSCSAYIHTSSMFGPVRFFSFSGGFSFWHGCSCKSLQGDWDGRLSLNWEWIICTLSTTGGIFSSADGPLLLFEQLCSGTEMFPLLLTQHLFGWLWGPAV